MQIHRQTQTASHLRGELRGKEGNKRLSPSVKTEESIHPKHKGRRRRIKSKAVGSTAVYCDFSTVISYSTPTLSFFFFFLAHSTQLFQPINWEFIPSLALTRLNLHFFFPLHKSSHCVPGRPYNSINGDNSNNSNSDS